MTSEGYELDINEMRFHHEIYISDVEKLHLRSLKQLLDILLGKNSRLDSSIARIKFFMN